MPRARLWARGRSEQHAYSDRVARGRAGAASKRPYAG